MAAFRAAAPLHTAQPPYNLFERGIEHDVLPYCRQHAISTLTYGALCRGLLSGRMSAETRFQGDDLRRLDPKFRAPRFARYLGAVERLDRFARDRWASGLFIWHSAGCSTGRGWAWRCGGSPARAARSGR